MGSAKRLGAMAGQAGRQCSTTDRPDYLAPHQFTMQVHMGKVDDAEVP